MKKLYALLAMMALMGSLSTASFAEEAQQGAVSETTTVAEALDTTCEDCWEKGSFTENHPVTSRIVTFPLRAATMAVGAPLGAVAGLFVGAKEGVIVANDATIGHIDTDESYEAGNITAEFFKTLVMFPVGVAADAVAIPVGGTVGMMEGMSRGAAAGFMFPDKF